MDEEQGNSLEVLDLEVDASATKATVYPQLIGKIISDSVLNSTQVVPSIRREWKEWIYGKVHIMHLRDNIYLFSFENDASAEEVFEDGPWVIMGDFLCLQRWGAQMSLEKVHFTHVPIWVQVHGLMFDQMTERNAEFLGSYIGKFLEVDRYCLNQDMKLGFVRIKVLLDCSAVLKPTMWVSRQGEMKYQVDFKYENLPTLCYNCGRFGHVMTECKNESHPHRQLFGPWLEEATSHLARRNRIGIVRKKLQTKESNDAVVDITEKENKDNWNNETDKLLPRMEEPQDMDIDCRSCETCPDYVERSGVILLVTAIVAFWILLFYIAL